MEGLKCACGADAETTCEAGDCAPSTPYCRPCYEKEHLDDWVPGESVPNAYHRARMARVGKIERDIYLLITGMNDFLAISEIGPPGYCNL